MQGLLPQESLSLLSPGMRLLTSAQLRRKRRDRAWKLWMQRSDEFRRRLENLLKKYFETERARVLRRLMTRIQLRAADFELEDNSEPLPDLNLIELRKAIRKEQEENNEDWDDVMLMLLLAVASTFTAITISELGYEYEGTPKETESWTRTFIEATLILVAAATLRKIISIIADSTKQQQTTQATITRINETYSKFIQNRVPGIASDMVGKVASIAQQIAVTSLDIDPDEIRQTWVSMRDKKVRESHQELDGVMRKLGEEFKPGLKFPRDTNAPIEETINCRCLAPGTLVRGRYVAAMRAKYRGTLRSITTRQGRRLSITPNHPVLTAQGWVAAGLINPGSQLIVYREQINSAISAMYGVHEDQCPPTIDDLFAALSAIGPVANVSSTGEYFNRDSRCFTSQIDAVTVDPVLMFNKTLANTEKHKQFFFDKSTRGLSSTQLTMSLNRISKQALPFHTFGFGLTSHIDAALQESASECPTTNPRYVRKMFQRLAAEIASQQVMNVSFRHPDSRMDGMIHLDGFGTVSNEYPVLLQNISHSVETGIKPSETLFNTCSTLIELDEVSFIEDRFHNDFVYDLQSPHGLLIAEDIITQNCWLIVEQARKQKRKAA